MLGEYILDGFKVAVIVGAMLIGYIAIIALLNGLVSGAFSLLSGGAIKWDFQTLIGFVFAPLAFLVVYLGKTLNQVPLWQLNYYLMNSLQCNH